jgi:uncharacterized protein YbjT (DUF2867 family)
LPEVGWRAVDIATLAAPDHWAPLLRGVDVVVNASGALQDGLRDNLSAVQDRAIRALIEGCERAGVRRFVQISAPGASRDADDAFLRTKANADAALKASTLEWIVLRPGLVWGRSATGGTGLVRMLSSVPYVQPIMLAKARIQTVDIDDVVEAIVASAEGAVAAGVDADLVEPAPLALEEMVRRVRAWHGFPPASASVRIPAPVGALLARLGDAAGWLGWRSPLRSTSLRALQHGILGDPAPWRALTGRDLGAFGESLAKRAATKQDRLLARMYVLMPLIVLSLAAFWIGSGIMGFVQMRAAASHLGFASGNAFVALGATADIILGAALLWRPSARAACLGMIGLTGFYLAAATIYAPQLWADPLGPLLKTIPAAVLALVCLALLEER